MAIEPGEVEKEEDYKFYTSNIFYNMMFSIYIYINNICTCVVLILQVYQFC